MDNLTIPVSLCIYDDVSITVYPVETGYDTELTYNDLKNAYIIGIRNKKKKIIGAGVVISTIPFPNELLMDAAACIFRKHKVTASLMRKADSLPAGKLRINLDNGTLKDAFSEHELNVLYTDFYMKNSISGNA
ncbi:negative control protein of sporulation [Pantoea agglomerans]